MKIIFNFKALLLLQRSINNYHVVFICRGGSRGGKQLLNTCETGIKVQSQT